MTSLFTRLSQSCRSVTFEPRFVCRCCIPPLDIGGLQPTSSDMQDALHTQQGLPWKHSTLPDIQQLTRLTLATEDSTAAAQALSGSRQGTAATYDLLAIQPLSERVLQQVSPERTLGLSQLCSMRQLSRSTCHSYCHDKIAENGRQPLVFTVGCILQACTSLEVDIISLDLAKRLPFRLKPGPLQAAVKRGLHFEVLLAMLDSISPQGAVAKGFPNVNPDITYTHKRMLIWCSRSVTRLP